MKVHFKEYELLDGSKKQLVQQVGDGSIIKRFELTPVPKQPEDVVCPHFLELKWAYGCPYSCAWCYLQGTLRMLPSQTKPVFKEYNRVMSHFEAFVFSDSPPEILNTGEIADSLMGERRDPPFSDFAARLVSETKHKALFLTKGTYIWTVLQLEPIEGASLPQDLLVMSWSLNAAPVADRWEKGAPRVQDRIEAARLVGKAGYEVRVRIDPIVPGYLSHYERLVDEVFRAFTPERITLGSLRGLQSTINAARNKSWVRHLTEPSAWGKRVDYSTRALMYAGIIDHLHRSHGYYKIALCKETVEMWKELGLDYMKCRCNCVW